MKVLIDECAPRALKTFVTNEGHECLTVQEAGWAGKQNGELLNLAEGDHFDVLVTVDTNLRYQQNLKGRRISILILEYSSNRLEHTSGNTFQRALRRSRKSSAAKLFDSAATAESAGSRRDEKEHRLKPVLRREKQIPHRRSRSATGFGMTGQGDGDIKSPLQTRRGRQARPTKNSTG